MGVGPGKLEEEREQKNNDGWKKEGGKEGRVGMKRVGGDGQWGVKKRVKKK